MPNVKANGIQIEYETFGDSSSTPLLLIMGLGFQMIRWDEELCEELVNRGYYVIRFDNRDVGLSTKFEMHDHYKYMKIITALERGEKVEVHYTLDDMADDAIGLLDAIGVDKVHVCGLSMGGMIAQTMAIRYPSRVRSLISIMSSTGNPELPRAKPEAMDAVLTPPPKGREEAIEHLVKAQRTLAGSSLPFDEERMRTMEERSYDRCFYLKGIARQLLAILSHGSRKSALKSVRVPTLVIHGSDDPLVPVEAGIDTAEAVPGAELLIIDGMGHTAPLPRVALPRILDAIEEITHRADSS
jgi:pimeloyl-ACP methyl ester carboxylesterase